MTLSLQQVSCQYGQHLAVDNLSFKLETGQILGLLGPNGAGKTTTLKMITGLQPPTKGSVSVMGYDMFSERMQAQSYLGYLPEHPPLYAHLSVWEHLKFVARLRKLPRSTHKERMKQMAEACHLSDVLHKKPLTLSKGYRQRTGLAMALLHEPALVVLDEPTSGLDPAQIQMTRELIRSLKSSATVVLSSHLLHEVEQICDEVIVLQHGKTLAHSTPDALQKGRHAQDFVLRIASATPDSEKSCTFEALCQHLSPLISAYSGTPEQLSLTLITPETQGKVAREIIYKGWDVLQLQPQRRSLENVFLELLEAESKEESEEKS